MLKKILFMSAMLVVMTTASTTFAAIACKESKVAGTYTVTRDNDIFGDGTVVHKLVDQLTLHADGTATWFWTGAADYLVNTGSASTRVGAWKCRADGKVVLTMVFSTYFPIEPMTRVELPSADIELSRTFRTTNILSVESDTQLLNLQSRSRRYTPSQDPSDPAGGTLGAVNPAQYTFTRLVASDADFLLP